MSFKSFLKSVAPMIGTAIGGPIGGLAVKSLTQAVLGEDKPLEGKELEQQIMAAVNTDPEALLRLKSADQDFKVKMEELGIRIEELNVEDRKDARQLAKDTSLKPQVILATLYVIGFMATLYTVFSGGLEFTSDQKDIAMYLLGILSAGLLQIMNFFFGSSSGSKEKTAKLMKQ